MAKKIQRAGDYWNEEHRDKEGYKKFLSSEELEEWKKQRLDNTHQYLKQSFRKIAYDAKKSMNEIPPRFIESAFIYDERVCEQRSAGKRHDPIITLKKNAKTILDACEEDLAYSEITKVTMRQAYENEQYDVVLDMALSVDTRRRSMTRSMPEHLSSMEKEQLERRAGYQDSFMRYLFEEVLDNLEDLEDIEKLKRDCYPILGGLAQIEEMCTSALSSLAGDLSHNSTATAKKHIKDALSEIEAVKRQVTDKT